MRRWLIIGAAVAGAAVLAASAVRSVLRDREWSRGGNSLVAAVEYRIADEAGLPAAVAALGGPRQHAAFLPIGGQAIVARLTWTGPESVDGRYHLVVLDQRDAQPLTGYESWNEGGDTGLGWDGRYDELARRYDWFGRPAGDPRAAVSVGASGRGTLVAVYLLGTGRPAVTDPAEDLLAAVFRTDADGDVRWAKRI